MAKTISNLDFFKVMDERTHKTYYGCNQAWYPTEWQRRSGCGPSVASNIFLYLYHHRESLALGKCVTTKKKCLLLMQEVWQYVTPTEHGIPTTKMFYEAVIPYIKSKGMNVNYNVCDLTAEKPFRPVFAKVCNFLDTALSKDAPVAFLNLCNGEEKNLDRWHWVTIISLGYAKDKHQVLANILDEGVIKKINLSLWYHTTTLGGGFVYFTNPSAVDIQAKL